MEYNTMSYFNYTDELFQSDFISLDGLDLTVLDKDDHTYPVEGWYWFDTLEEAKAFFNIEET
jgi:hypothetical protein